MKKNIAAQPGHSVIILLLLLANYSRAATQDKPKLVEDKFSGDPPTYRHTFTQNEIPNNNLILSLTPYEDGHAVEVKIGGKVSTDFSAKNGKVRVLLKKNDPALHFPLEVSISKTGGSAPPDPAVTGPDPAVTGSGGGGNSEEDKEEKKKPSGKPLVDAIKMKALIDANDKQVYEFFKTYTTQGANSPEEVKTAFAGNPFMEDFLKEIKLPEAAAVKLNASQSAFESGGTSTSGVLSPSFAIDALSTFIAKRFKEEINIAYLDKFREVLNTHEEMGLLFPETYKVLRDADPYNYNTYLQTMKEAFEKDLPNIPQNLKAACEYEKDHGRLTASDPYYFFLMGLDIISSVEKAQHPAVTFAAISESGYADQLTNKNAAAAVRLLTILSRSMESNDGTSWVTAEEFKKLIGNNEEAHSLRNLFLGLVYAKEKDNLAKIDITVTGAAAKQLDVFITENKDRFIHLADSVILVANVIQANLTDIKNKRALKGDAFQLTDYYNYTRSVIDMMHVVTNITHFIKNVDGVNSIYNTYLPLLTDVNEMANDVYQKKYGLALGNALEIAVLVDSKFFDAGKKAEIMKYGTFMVNVANAKTRDEVVDALETAALPVGSYKIKRAAIFNVSLQTYAGLTGGYEWLVPDAKNTTGTRSWNFGFTAPVGLAFSVGTGRLTGLRGASLSLFTSIIDLGAPVLFRLQDENAELPSTITWKQVLAPGAFLVLGFPNSPVSFSVGGEYSPQLRKIDEVSRNTFRLNAGLLIDIPVFNLYTKLPDTRGEVLIIAAKQKKKEAKDEKKAAKRENKARKKEKKAEKKRAKTKKAAESVEEKSKPDAPAK